MRNQILIIEDAPTQAEYVKGILETEGFIVDIALTGKEGLRIALQKKPDLILLDLILPDISGFDVLVQLKKNVSLADTIVIVLSEKDEVEDISKAFNLGADDYMIKPPIAGFLSKKIKLYLGIKS